MQKLSVAKNEITHIDIDKIYPNPYQPRNSLNDSNLKGLALSIKKYGIIEPISVRNLKGLFYEVICGERRLNACKSIGMEKIPALIYNIDEKDSAFITLIENIQRKELAFLEEGYAMQSLMVDFGYSKDDISRIIGRDRNDINATLSILCIQNELKENILKNNISKEHISLLLALPDDKTKKEVLEKIIKFDLNTKKTKLLIDKVLKEDDQNYENKQKMKVYISDIRLFTNTIKNAVDTMRKSGIDTKYSLEKNGDNYEINIKLSM